jgi:transposase
MPNTNNVSISRQLAEARTPTERARATRLMNEYIQVKLQEKESQLRNGFLSNASRIKNQSSRSRSNSRARSSSASRSSD